MLFVCKINVKEGFEKSLYKSLENKILWASILEKKYLRLPSWAFGGHNVFLWPKQILMRGQKSRQKVKLYYFSSFFQTLITFLWIIIDGSQVNGLKTEIHPSPSYFQSSGDRTHILFISSARSSSVHHGLLHTYIQAHFIRFFKGAGVFERPGQTMKDL